jgi:hypothetical protein
MNSGMTDGRFRLINIFKKMDSGTTDGRFRLANIKKN